MLLIYLNNKDDEEKITLEEIKLKNQAYWLNPELYFKIYPQDEKTEEDPQEDGIAHVVPKTEKELLGVFEDLKSLGLPINEQKKPNSRAFENLAKGLKEGKDIDEIDLELEGEIKRMKSAMKLESID